MIKKKKKLLVEDMPEFQASIDAMPADSKIFVDKSLEIADYIFRLMEEKGMKQKDLADKMGKSEAELSKILGGMHNLTLRSIAKLEAALGEMIICTPRNKAVPFPEKEITRASLKGVIGQRSEDYHPGLSYETKVIKMFSTDNAGAEVQMK